MGSIFKNQSALRISLDTDTDLTDASAVYINYTKANGVEGQWNAQISDATNGIIYYDVASVDILDEVGYWNLWAEVLYTGGDIAYGSAAQIFVSERGVI